MSSFTQYKIGVSEKSVGYESGNHNAFTVVVYECSVKDIEKHWKKEMKDMKANVSSKKNEMKGDDARVKDMGENTFDIYAITKETDNGIELSVAYDLGGAFLSSSQHSDQSKVIKEIMYNFAVKSTKEGIRGILKKEEGVQQHLEKEHENLVKSKEKLEKDIENWEKDIEKAKKDIEQNKKDQESKNKEIDDQKKVVEEVKSKEKAVK
jgi:molecular chaperone DnaK (HSP70)